VGDQVVADQKNNHVVYAYGRLADGKWILIVGFTNEGLDFLRMGPDGEKKTLLINPPMPVAIDQIIFFNEDTKEDLKNMFRRTGIPLTETDLRNL
jgi:hypothetical protein